MPAADSNRSRDNERAAMPTRRPPWLAPTPERGHPQDAAHPSTHRQKSASKIRAAPIHTSAAPALQSWVQYSKRPSARAARARASMLPGHTSPPRSPELCLAPATTGARPALHTTSTETAPDRRLHTSVMQTCCHSAGPTTPARLRWRRPHRKTPAAAAHSRSEEHTSELQSLAYLVCRLLLEK